MKRGGFKCAKSTALPTLAAGRRFFWKNGRNLWAPGGGQNMYGACGNGRASPGAAFGNMRKNTIREIRLQAHAGIRKAREHRKRSPRGIGKTAFASKSEGWGHGASRGYPEKPARLRFVRPVRKPPRGISTRLFQKSRGAARDTRFFCPAKRRMKTALFQNLPQAREMMIFRDHDDQILRLDRGVAVGNQDLAAAHDRAD